MNWHKLKSEEVFERTKSNEKGLSTDEAKHRLHKVGPNELQEGKKKTIFFEDPFRFGIVFVSLPT